MIWSRRCCCTSSGSPRTRRIGKKHYADVCQQSRIGGTRKDLKKPQVPSCSRVFLSFDPWLHQLVPGAIGFVTKCSLPMQALIASFRPRLLTALLSVSTLFRNGSTSSQSNLSEVRYISQMRRMRLTLSNSYSAIKASFLSSQLLSNILYNSSLPQSV